MDKSQNNWYALYTRARWEKKVSHLLDESGIENYLPLYKTIRVWSDRKKMVTLPLFPSYVFIKTGIHYCFKVQGTPGVARIISFEKRPVIIPDQQIEAIKLILSKDVEFETVDNKPEPGDLIEVIAGNLIGLKGDLIEYRGKKKIAVRLDVVEKSIILNIPLKYAKILKKNV